MPCADDPRPPPGSVLVSTTNLFIHTLSTDYEVQPCSHNECTSLVRPSLSSLQRVPRLGPVSSMPNCHTAQLSQVMANFPVQTCISPHSQLGTRRTSCVPGQSSLPMAIAISRSKPASTSSHPSTAPSMTKLRLRKEAYIPRSHLRNANNREDQAGIFSPKSTSAVEMFAHETYLDELQDTEIKRKSIKLLREFKQFKENTRNRSVKSARKSLSGAQENTNITG